MGCGDTCAGGGCQSGGCGGCGGCGGGRELWLTEGEVELLMRFAQLAFLPIARRWDSEEPVYLEDGAENAPRLAPLFQALAFKGLITIDYDQPLLGFDYGAYGDYPCRGSMALTAQGQQVVELLEVQGAEK